MQTEPAVVFYVDDNPKSRGLLTSILLGSGFQVITAHDPVEALGLCKKISFDVALLDYQMPVMTGTQLAQEIKFLMPDVPVVLLSGRTSLPVSDLVFVDAHFGCETTLDDLLDKLKMLVRAKIHTVAIQRSPIHWSDAT
jgi:CheY-like chemotaxis protein